MTKQGLPASSRLHRFQVVLLGYNRVGKSSLLDCYFRNKHYSGGMTVEDYFKETIRINNEETHLCILVTEKIDYEFFQHHIYKKDMLLFVFCVHKPETFEILPEFLSMVSSEYRGLKAPAIVMVANELDSPHRYISFEQGQQLAEAYGAYYIEVSARKNINVTQLFELIVWILRRR